ncbi:MAG: hypothetical protein U0271_12305 [Polyangiaceae bacterium]
MKYAELLDVLSPLVIGSGLGLVAVARLEQSKVAGAVGMVVAVAAGTWVFARQGSARSEQHTDPATTSAAMAKLEDVRGVGSYRAAADVPISAREFYGRSLVTSPLSGVRRQPGRVLDSVLERPASATWLVGITTAAPLLLVLFARHPRVVQWAAATSSPILWLAGLFAATSLALLGHNVGERLRVRSFEPRVEVSASPAYLGAPIEILVDGGLRLFPVTVLEVSLVCREIVTFSEGSNTRTEIVEVWASPILRAERRNGRFEYANRGAATPPATLPHSFSSAHNQVVWSVHLHGQAPLLLDYDEHFEVALLPKPA